MRSPGSCGLPHCSRNVPRATRRRGLYLLHGTSLSKAGCLQPRPSSSDRSGQHGAGPEAPGRTGRRVPAAGVEAESPGHSGLPVGTGASLSPAPTHLLGQQGNEVSLELGLDDLHHVLDLGGLAAVNELVQSKQLLRAAPSLGRGTSVTTPARTAGPRRLPGGSVSPAYPAEAPTRMGRTGHRGLWSQPGLCCPDAKMERSHGDGVGSSMSHIR